MNEPSIPIDPRQALELGRLLGQRRALSAIGGRCSAAHAHLLRRIRDEKLYLPLAPSWEKFCGAGLALSRRHADRIIALLNRFGPIYFELDQLIGLSPEEYLAIEPAVREYTIVVNGEAVSLIPENSPKILEAVSQLLYKSRSRRRTRRVPTPESLHARVTEITRRGRVIFSQLAALYQSARSGKDREFILESATELRLILLQLGVD
jgi:hypothetical protein